MLGMRYLQQTKVDKKVKVDLKDRKILSLLAQDARMSASQISKKIGLSRDAVSYRINNLNKKGVIQGSRTIIDISKFGYEAYHLFLQLNQPTEKVENELIEKLREYPFIRAIIKFNGRYDLELALIARNVREFDEFLEKVLEDCSKYLNNYEVMAITKSYSANILPKSFLEFKEKSKKIKEVKIKTNEKDKEILSLLANDTTLPFYKIADKVNLSPDAVIYRIKRLINGGVIKKFVPVINYASLSYNVYAILLRVNSLKEKEEALKNFLQNDKNVLWSVKCVGKYNVLIYVCVHTNEELHETLNELRTHFPENIVDYETLIAYEEYKYTYFPDYGFI